jgi:hypothetical protein
LQISQSIQSTYSNYYNKRLWSYNTNNTTNYNKCFETI